MPKLSSRSVRAARLIAIGFALKALTTVIAYVMISDMYQLASAPL